MKYRADIDGLRAYAVLPVLFYHVGFGWSSGGFVGVDIFFVISGFLITNLIYKQVAADTFSFGTFYGRRIKRLFPALTAVMIFSGIGSFLLLTPDDFEKFAGAAVFTPVGMSNIFFWLDSGYWDSSKYAKPLLHTWSLAVEEQFYLIWPLLLVLTFKFRRVLVLPLLFLLSLVSLIAAEVFLSTNPSAVFYLMPFRIAEFGAGAALVWAPRLKNDKLEAVLLFGGLAIIIASTVLITEKMRFPGLLALVPCLGASLAIYAGRAPIMSLALTNSVAVWLGKISYSLYLVHWPLIVFWKYFTLRPLSLTEQIIICVLSTVLGALSYFFIEQPFRKTQKLSMPAFGLAASGVAMALTLTTASIWAQQGWTWRLGGDVALDLPRGADGCRRPYCSTSQTAANDFIVVGDSFGQMYYAGLRNRYYRNASERKHFSIFTYRPNCHWFHAERVIKRANDTCQKRLDDFFSLVEKDNVETVILAHRWQKVGLHIKWADREDFYGQRFAAMMARPEMASVKKIVLVLGVPEFEFEYDSRQCFQSPKFLPYRNCDLAPMSNFAKLRRINRRVLNAIRRNVPEGVELAVENPFGILCNKNYCRQAVNGNSVYWDKDHLSNYASRYVVNKWTALED